MSKGAEIKNFEDVCELVGGSQPSKNDFIYEPRKGYIRLIQVRDYRTDKYITYIPKDGAKRFCNKEDIMIGRYGPPIFGIFKGLEGAYNVALMKVVVNEKICNKDYFYWFLKTDKLRQFVEHSSKRAAGQDGVRKELLDKYPVLIPPLPEQQRIVAILDEAFAAIAKAKANAEQNLKNAKELFESYLQGVFENKGKMSESGFSGLKDEQDVDNNKSNKKILKSSNLANPDSDNEGWEEKTLGEMIEIKNGKNQQAVLSETGQYKVMGSAGNVMGYATDYICEVGTTIIGRKGNISKPIYINERFWNVDTAFGFFPKNEIDIDKRFVYYLCLGIDFKSMNRGTTIPSLVKSELQTIQISFPKSLKTQQTIVKKLDALSAETKKLEIIYQQKLNDLEELKKSVLQKAFSGELKTKTLQLL